MTSRVGMPHLVPPLPEGASMAVWPRDALGPSLAAGAEGQPEPLYVNGGKWLHPLFDLVELLSGDSGDAKDRDALTAAGDLFLRDRVIGRGAAFLILRTGIRHAWADVVSDGALALFEANGASLDGAERVASIGCRTESLLREVSDPELAWRMLLERRAAGRDR
jgi:hypothetical protein